MAQNIYDDPDFFAGYAALTRSTEGLDGAFEWPAVRSLLPPVAGLDVVDLGCGYGWFARWAAAEGARSVLGIDLSERMLARARELTGDDPVVRYDRQDLDDVELAPSSFDVAYSSLALHYLARLDDALTTVAGALRPAGAFVCSVEHPIYTAPSTPRFVVDEGGGRTWPVDGYLDEGRRTTEWLAPGVVKFHRTIATYVAALRRAGFDLTDMVEFGPTVADLDAHPDWAGERDRPMFLLLAARRSG